jgi:hypothetical protein
MNKDEEESSENKVLVVNPSRNSIRNLRFYVSMKIMEKITHSCLIYNGFRSNVMPKIIMEQLGLYCSNENLKNMLPYNNQQQSTIGKIKDMTLVLCAHHEIHTTCNIQLIDMTESNYLIILGRDS